jgi:hypothetical protein
MGFKFKANMLKLLMTIIKTFPKQCVYLIEMELAKRTEFFNERKIRDSDVNLFRDGFVLREHRQDDALSGFVENRQHFSRSFRQKVGQNFGLGGQNVVVDLKAGPVLFAHLTNALAVKVVSARVNVGPEEIPESVVNLGARAGHADVLADGATSGVLQVFDGLKHVAAVIVVDVQATVGSAFSRQTTFATRRFVIVFVRIVVLKDRFKKIKLNGSLIFKPRKLEPQFIEIITF